MVAVKAIGRNFDGSSELSPFPMRIIFPLHHEGGHWLDFLRIAFIAGREICVLSVDSRGGSMISCHLQVRILCYNVLLYF